MTTRLVAGAIFLLGYLTTSPAFGWGLHGHETINATAVKLLTDRKHPMAPLFHLNLALVRRLAGVPGREWAKSQPEEKYLHYFIADAFTPTSADELAVVTLPSGEFADVRATYERLAQDNLELLKEYGRTEAKDQTLAGLGTAPWRIAQLFDLTVTAIQAGNWKDALYHMSTLGHYIGDLSQPLHTTLSAKGEFYPVPIPGVFDALESKELLSASSSTNIESAARKAMGSRGLDGLHRKRLIPELLKLVASGYRDMDALFSAYARHQGHPGPGRSLASVSATESETVGTMVESRLGDAAALLARVWASAYNAAGRPMVKLLRLDYEDFSPLKSYPSPDYLRSPSQSHTTD